MIFVNVKILTATVLTVDYDFQLLSYKPLETLGYTECLWCVNTGVTFRGGPTSCIVFLHFF